jgi:nucleotide-binding universal stress UspA family protein
MAKKILAAVDGSEHAWKALDLAADMAKQHGAQLVALHVVPFEPMPEALRRLRRPNTSPWMRKKAATITLGIWATN